MNHNDLQDLTGRSFGYWVVTGQAPRDGNKTMWHCRCATCGYETIRRGQHLKNGKFEKCFGSHFERAGLGGSGAKAPGHANATEAFGVYRLRAKKHGTTFTISRDEFVTISQQDCHYCGAPPSQVTNRQHFNGAFVYNGIDRKDSALGYVIGNCLPCCGRCNTMKSDVPYDEFLQRVSLIHERAQRRLAQFVLPLAAAWPPRPRRSRQATGPPG